MEKLKNSKGSHEEEKKTSQRLREEIERLKKEIEKMKMEHSFAIDQLTRESAERENKIKSEHKNLVD